MTGIDISADQGDDVPGAWEFMVVKASEALATPNYRFDAQWANAARTTRGAYHYARPMSQLSGVEQGNFFSTFMLAHGFKPGVDIWMLDCEDGLNPGVTSGQWRAFINDFMAIAVNKLGRRGFMYAGWPFLQERGIADLPYRYMWWLPSYIADRSFGDGVPAGLVVIHQYSDSGGALDLNDIINHPAFYQTIAPLPAPLPPGVFVQPDIYPPAGIVALCAFDHPTLGHCAAAVKPDGSVLCDPPTAYLGGANGKPYFVNRVAADITGVPGGYQIKDTADELYGPKF